MGIWQKKMNKTFRKIKNLQISRERKSRVERESGGKFAEVMELKERERERLASKFERGGGGGDSSELLWS